MVLAVDQRDHPHARDGRANRSKRRGSRSWRAIGTNVALVAALALAACGGGDSSAGRSLTPAERASAARSRAAIETHCRRLGRFIAGRRGPPSAAELAEAERATDTLVALARAKPHATLSKQSGSLVLVLGDLAEQLEGINCAPELERRIEVALASLPPP